MTLQEQLTDAKATLHEWIMGRTARVYVDQNGERVEYSTAGMAHLRRYIDELERQISGAAISGPMRPWLA